MSAPKIVSVLILSVGALISGCDRADAKIPLTTAPGLAVPDVDQLATKLESSLRYPQTGSKVYTRDGGKWVEVKSLPVDGHFAAIVRSFDATRGMAYLELTSREYSMPLVQIWRFDGMAWGHSVDPGIFIR